MYIELLSPSLSLKADDRESNLDALSPNPVEELQDRRSASDGAIYLQKEMLQIKANRTAGGNLEEEGGDLNFNRSEVLANQSPIRIGKSCYKDKFHPIREQPESVESDESYKINAS